MSKLKRFYYPGNVYFIAAITKYRARILCDNFDLVKLALKNVHHKIPYRLISWVFLPDHFHIILDSGKVNPDRIIQRFKTSFGQLYRKRYGLISGSIWQSRFWDHVIRNERDMMNHMIYINNIPVKHGLTDDPNNWPRSSSHGFSENDFSEYDKSEFGEFVSGFGE